MAQNEAHFPWIMTVRILLCHTIVEQLTLSHRGVQAVYDVLHEVHQAE